MLAENMPICWLGKSRGNKCVPVVDLKKIEVSFISYKSCVMNISNIQTQKYRNEARKPE